MATCVSPSKNSEAAYQECGKNRCFNSSMTVRLVGGATCLQPVFMVILRQTATILNMIDLKRTDMNKL